MAPVRPPGMPKTNSMPACSSTRTIASGTETCESRSRVAMSQPFFEELEIDSMMSKNSCTEHTTRRQLQQQACNTHQAGLISGVGAIGGKACCARGGWPLQMLRYQHLALCSQAVSG